MNHRTKMTVTSDESVSVTSFSQNKSTNSKSSVLRAPGSMPPRPSSAQSTTRPLSSARNGKQLTSRVKVGLRCRPPFEDEVRFARGNFFPIVETSQQVYGIQESAGDGDPSSIGKVALTLMSGQRRDFYFDCAFGPSSTQDQVYDSLAYPVVSGVLNGFNGTVMAYGQTGTGKTYTMGILDAVDSEHAGIIPRSLAQIFDYAGNNVSTRDVVVTLSFLQIYRESIQDLLAPIAAEAVANTGRSSYSSSSPGGGGGMGGSSMGGGGGNEEQNNLPIREDPVRGFYVEGLHEFYVRTYAEAEALVNVGLENRAIASTQMNATSSRSHTVITVVVEQKFFDHDDDDSVDKRGAAAAAATAPIRTIKGKLLMVDLAGSERVRRTISKGTRLSEAKSINTSLSALGNVIAALATPGNAHVPYRDSKLTRLLQDSLGGSSAMALIATVGPAPVNFGETLSTLLFAARCMSVKVNPSQHEEVDYVEMCARLQDRIGKVEADMAQRMNKQAEQYEGVIRGLREQLDTAVDAAPPAGNDTTTMTCSTQGTTTDDAGGGVNNDEYRTIDASNHYFGGHHGSQSSPSPSPTIVAALSGFVDLVSQLRSLSTTTTATTADAATTATTAADGSNDDAGNTATAAAGSTDIDFASWVSVFTGGGGAASGETSSSSPPSPSSSSSPSTTLSKGEKTLIALVGYCYEVLCTITASMELVVEKDTTNEEIRLRSVQEAIAAQEQREKKRLTEMSGMTREDQQYKATDHITTAGEPLGGHLAPLSLSDAMARVETTYGSNSSPLQGRTAGAAAQRGGGRGSGRGGGGGQKVSTTGRARKDIVEFTSVEEFAEHLTNLLTVMDGNLQLLTERLSRKDKHYDNVKNALANQLVDQRKREEELVNWSCVLKYLLSGTSKLRRQVKEEREKFKRVEIEREFLAAQMSTTGGGDGGSVAGTPYFERRFSVDDGGTPLSSNGSVFSTTAGERTPQQAGGSWQEAGPSHRGGERGERGGGERGGGRGGGGGGGSFEDESSRSNRSSNSDRRGSGQSLGGRSISAGHSSQSHNHSRSHSDYSHPPGAAYQYPQLQRVEAFGPPTNRRFLQPGGERNSGRSPISSSDRSRSPSIPNSDRGRSPIPSSDRSSDRGRSPIPSSDRGRGRSPIPSSDRGRSPSIPNSDRGRSPIPVRPSSAGSQRSLSQPPRAPSPGSLRAQSHKPTIEASAVLTLSSKEIAGGGGGGSGGIAMQRGIPPTSGGGSPQLLQTTNPMYTTNIHTSHQSATIHQGFPIQRNNTAAVAETMHRRSASSASIPGSSRGGGSARSVSSSSSSIHSTIPTHTPTPTPTPTPSEFARQVVSSLGVSGDAAVEAMEVVDRITAITSQEVQAMDKETRAQILQMRQDLGIDAAMTTMAGKGTGGGRSSSGGGASYSSNNSYSGSSSSRPPKTAASSQHANASASSSIGTARPPGVTQSRDSRDFAHFQDLERSDYDWDHRGGVVSRPPPGSSSGGGVGIGIGGMGGAPSNNSSSAISNLIDRSQDRRKLAAEDSRSSISSMSSSIPPYVAAQLRSSSVEEYSQLDEILDGF